jgi:hypothetical protein
VANPESLSRELNRRGYECSTENTAEGSVCIIHAGPNGRFDAPVEVHQQLPRDPHTGGFQWRARGVVHRATLDVGTEALANEVIASILEA